MVNCKKKVIVDAKQGRFSRMKFSIGRLKRAHRRKLFNMISEARMNDAF